MVVSLCHPYTRHDPQPRRAGTLSDLNLEAGVGGLEVGRLELGTRPALPEDLLVVAVRSLPSTPELIRFKSVSTR